MKRITEAHSREITNGALREYLSVDGPTTRRFLASEDGVQTGFIEIDTIGTKFEVRKLVVGRSFRGRGIGRRLLARAELLARRLGHASVWLRAHSLDDDAMTTDELTGWYRRLGYESQLGTSMQWMRKPLQPLMRRKVVAPARAAVRRRS